MTDQKEGAEKIKINQKWLSVVGIFGLVLVIGSLAFVLTRSASSEEARTQPSPQKKIQPTPESTRGGFLGEKGQAVQAEGSAIYLDESVVEDGNLHAFNYQSEKLGKTIYFFVIRASDGTYRAAANACEVCFESQKGFTQVGDQIRCENCRITYSKDQIALQKGGCNPRPISNDVPVSGGRLVIDLADVEATADLF